MKAVLASLKPYYYYLVGEGIKCVEVRKTYPKAEDWNKDTFFYMSRDEKSFAKIPKEFQEKYRKHFGKVGLRFLCDTIFTISCYYSDPTARCVHMEQPYTCLTDKEMIDYLGNGVEGYGWHITNLVIYDEPRELGEFLCKCNRTYCTGCEDFCDEGEISFRMCGGVRMITRPPQSWYYCEEVNDG